MGLALLRSPGLRHSGSAPFGCRDLRVVRSSACAVRALRRSACAFSGSARL